MGPPALYIVGGIVIAAGAAFAFKEVCVSRAWVTAAVGNADDVACSSSFMTRLSTHMFKTFSSGVTCVGQCARMLYIRTMTPCVPLFLARHCTFTDSTLSVGVIV